jgi:hypothetical protein
MTREELQQRVSSLEMENKLLLRYLGALRARFGDAVVNDVIACTTAPERRVDGEAWRDLIKRFTDSQEHGQ